MSVTPLPSTMCSVLLIDGNEDRVLWIKRSLESMPVHVAGRTAVAAQVLSERRFDAVLISVPIFISNEFDGLLETLTSDERAIPFAIVAQLNELPILIRTGITGHDVISLNASNAIFRQAVLTLAGKRGLEPMLPAPATLAEDVLLKTIARAVKVQHAILRQEPPAESPLSLQVVLPKGDVCLSFQVSLQDHWGLALRPNDAEHPVVQHLHGLTGAQEVYARKSDREPDTWLYAAFLPWTTAEYVTLFIEIIGGSALQTHRDFMEQARQLAIEEMPKIHLPKVALIPGQAVLIPEYDWVATGSYIGPDRRVKPTPLVGRFTFFGRRRALPQGLIQLRGFVDKVSAWVTRFFIAYAFLAGVDTALTVLFRQRLPSWSLAAWFTHNSLSLLAFLFVARFEKTMLGRPLLSVVLLSYVAMIGYWMLLLKS